FSASFLLSIPYVYYHFSKGCQGWEAFLFSSAVNASFLVLFIDFYRRSYTSPAAKKPRNLVQGASASATGEKGASKKSD
ncbi:hypothetical protein HK405_014829, partial [Cladochytrium tenue]